MTEPLMCLSLWQPFASLLAAGVKGPETRGWQTKHRGRIGIAATIKPAPARHWPAADTMPKEIASGLSVATSGVRSLSGDGCSLPLGALLATAELVDCVPILGHEDPSPGGACFRVDLPFLWFSDAEGDVEHADDQLPFGIWEPGRWAWLFEDVKPTTERCPWCWGERWVADHDGCSVCGGGPYRSGRGVCDPVPVRGMPGLWPWTPQEVAA